MASTQVVNFRADSISYQKTKEILAGHQEISEGKVTSLADVRKEFNLD